MTFRKTGTLLLCALLSGCAAGPRAAPSLDPPRCVSPETLVCYGKKASKLDRELEQVDFCRCERVNNTL